MSKDVLSTFGILNKNGRNESSFLQLSQKAKDQSGQYGDKRENVEKIRALFKGFSDYVEGLKMEVTKNFPKDKEGNYPYEKMYKGDLIDRMLFSQEKLSPQGQELLDKIQNYPAQIKAISGSFVAEVEMKKIEKRFGTRLIFSEKAGKNFSWMEYNYHGFPLIASNTKLTQLQADIKTTESDVMTGMFQSDLVVAASLTAICFLSKRSCKGKNNSWKI